jgi:predicted NUDIX family phosphoesterase
MSKMDEQIVVAPRKGLFGPDDKYYFQGVEVAVEPVNETLMQLGKTTEIMRRGDAEENPDYKQPIPYIVLTQMLPTLNEGKELFVFCYRRLEGGAEARLHSRLSVGLGGHMNVLFNETTMKDVFREEAIREINEELILSHNIVDFDFIGLINDDENEVGRVHIGILGEVHLPTEVIVNVREVDQLDGGWYTLRELLHPKIFMLLEPWSQYAVQALNAKYEQA